ncbi:exopolysaccharide biosynthesis protein [Brevundimonas lenta]|uniref:Exopolysaccharide biosynthesis protein n=1 Tax=Brevundimonas lenta TaxID=424796 RepID=A0A7W6JCB0_9CAUL|nr:exopolysaccharide biosynthesis protein [Brevundimonas lenta]MBB4082495.1 hypothetical protein [Brevundimonas lenta]
MPDYDYQSDDRPFSQVIEDIGAKTDPKLYLGELVNAFGERGIGALLLFLGLISALIGALPGTTTVIGLPILLIALQLVIRRDQLWMPAWVLRSSIDRGGYRTAISKVLKPLRKVERWSRPRYSPMTNEVGEVMIGLACTGLVVILMLPIIFANLVPSLIIAAFGFGLMQRDGAVIVVAWIGTIAFALAAWLAWEVVSAAITNSWEWVTGLF